MQHGRRQMSDGGDRAAVAAVFEDERMRHGNMDQPLVSAVSADHDNDIGAAQGIGFAEGADGLIGGKLGGAGTIMRPTVRSRSHPTSWLLRIVSPRRCRRQVVNEQPKVARTASVVASKPQGRRRQRQGFQCSQAPERSWSAGRRRSPCSARPCRPARRLWFQVPSTARARRCRSIRASRAGSRRTAKQKTIRRGTRTPAKRDRRTA